MAIRIKSLEVDKLSKKSLERDYLYKDIYLDIENSVSFNNQLNRTETLRDIAALYDVESVKNAVATALLTAPGEKILNPLYGVDLRQFLFEPVDNFTTSIIEDTIKDELPRFEPRISVVNVMVVGDEEQNTYFIDLQIDVPSLGITGLSLKSELNSVGYTIL